ncbi:hypothetical protein BDZ45DRAFT_184860 [Acephala macrosclerotiorum]|nr:hypothetical protein BDZ45DRAFT_184860 [Acephala macrosclerotiorum]
MSVVSTASTSSSAAITTAASTPSTASSASPAATASTLTTSTTPGHFPQFKKLPFEIKLMIWKAYTPGSRVIEIYSNGVAKRSELYPHLRANYTIPGMLYACHDSRAVALRTYRLLGAPWSNIKPLYLDLSRDILLVANVASLTALLRPVYPLRINNQLIRDCLRHLMLGEDIGDLNWHAGYIMLRSLTRLETLTMAINPPPPSDIVWGTEDGIGEEEEEVQLDPAAVAARYQAATAAVTTARAASHRIPQLDFLTSWEMYEKFRRERVCIPIRLETED